MSRKDNLKKYGNLLHNAATKSFSKETVEDVIIIEEDAVVTTTESSNEELVEATELPTTHSYIEGIFPDTLEEEEEEKIGGKYLHSIFPDTLED